MTRSENERSIELSLCQLTGVQLEEELNELEDAYAECLADNIDARTLTMLWLKIKEIKKEITSRASVL